MKRDAKGRFCKEEPNESKWKPCELEEIFKELAEASEKAKERKKKLEAAPNFASLYAVMPDKSRKRLKELHETAGKVLIMIDALAAFKIAYTGEAKDAASEAIETLSSWLECLEFEMQKVWGIKQDANFHTWWLKSKFCTCPKMDNTDPAYFGNGKIIAGDCPVHGDCK